jgi:ADP-heptose:LPS heptosyltransferase
VVSASAELDDDNRIEVGNCQGLNFDGESQLFSKTVVCIHPASGNEMRQWPAEHFGSLINLLIEHTGVHVAVIGGLDDQDLISNVLERVKQRSAIWSLVGKLKLSEVPLFISKCALFVGNNSGPHHIAAGVGTPTIGIHSGVVDSREWGPIGPRAIAISREMSCSPCYLLKIENCHRDFACMRQLEPGEVFRHCKRMLALRKKR